MHLCLLLVALFSFHTHSVATEGMQAWEITLIGVVVGLVVGLGLVAGIAIMCELWQHGCMQCSTCLYWLMHAVACIYKCIEYRYYLCKPLPPVLSRNIVWQV